MIKTILTATDGSRHARKALELAADFSDKYGARLVVMHVVGQGEVPDELAHMAEVEHVVDPKPADTSLPRVAIPHGEGSRSAQNHRIHVFIAEKILEEAEITAKRKGVKDIHQLTSEGDPADCILEAAAREKPDMIVMGSRGLSNLKSLLVGSVSRKVSHLAECTCVCVK